MEAIFDDKENIPPYPFLGIWQHQVDQQLGFKKKPVLGVVRPRKPLADITHLFIGNAWLARSSSVSGIDVLVGPSITPAMLNSRKRRALDDSDILWSARTRSLRKGFR